LKTRKWKEADQETAQRMCEVMGRQQEGLLRVEDVQQFPCTDLRTIDGLWVKYSDGKFGFSVQKRIWQECGSPVEYSANWGKFGARVGWKKGSLNENWINYTDVVFNTQALAGHLPVLCILSTSVDVFDFGRYGIRVYIYWVLWFSSLMHRLVGCSESQ
jgi:hypothetical protein